MRWIAISLGLAGCGRIDFEPIVRDASIDATPCQNFGAFSAPHMITELATTDDDWGPWLSADKLDIYFSRGSGSIMNDLYRAHRDQAALPFGAAIPLAGVNTGSSEEDPVVTADGLTLYFDRTGDTIFRATRADLTAEFGNAAPAADLNGSPRTTTPRTSADSIST